MFLTNWFGASVVFMGGGRRGLDSPPPKMKNGIQTGA